MPKDQRRPYAHYRKSAGFATRAIRAGIHRSGYNEHSPPVYLSSGFWFDNAQSMAAIFSDEAPGSAYSRYNNPSTEELICKLVALEGCEDGVVTASGMSAIFLSILSLLQPGNHFIATRALFGSTYKLFSDLLPRWGVSCTFVDPTKPEEWEAAVVPATALFFIETPSNPALEVVDLTQARALCDAFSLLMVVDNCTCSPYLQQPAAFGADLVIHSATKYLDGQGRVLGGAVLGPSKLITPCYQMLRQTGATLSAFNAWLIARSIDTLAVRMDRHCASALAIAKWLQHQPQVRLVRYPFLPDNPQQELARRQMKAGGGLVCFEVADLQAGKRFLDALELITLSANFGDTRSIASHPASTTHARLSPEQRQSLGISDGTVRLSVGLEEVDDIQKDLAQALAKAPIGNES